jgi:tRNA A37 methylthiotransferase MiaB
VSDAEKTARIVALQTLQREIQTRLHEAAVGTEVQVLVDSVSRRGPAVLSGRTGGNDVVSFPAPGDGRQLTDWLGTTVPVRVTRGGPHSLSGDAVVALAREEVPC